jgi:hypothetical protein
MRAGSSLSSGYLLDLSEFRSIRDQRAAAAELLTWSAPGPAPCTRAWGHGAIGSRSRWPVTIPHASSGWPPTTRSRIAYTLSVHKKLIWEAYSVHLAVWPSARPARPPTPKSLAESGTGIPETAPTGKIRQTAPAPRSWPGSPRCVPQVKKLVRDGALQLSLFDQADLAEITHPDYPGERLVACKNRCWKPSGPASENRCWPPPQPIWPRSPPRARGPSGRCPARTRSRYGWARSSTGARSPSTSPSTSARITSATPAMLVPHQATFARVTMRRSRSS